MRYEVQCFTCNALGWCRGEDVEGDGFEANDDDLAEVCQHLKDGGEYIGTGKHDYDAD